MEPGDEEDVVAVAKPYDETRELIQKVAAITFNLDRTAAQAFVGERVATILNNDWLMSAAGIRERACADIGYIAGYLPTEMGNQTLQLFQVKHPYFGDKIPSSIDEALEIGRAIGRELLDRKLSKKEQARRDEQRKTLGIALPEIGDEVSNEDAEKILTAIREKSEAARKEAEKKAKIAEKAARREAELDRADDTAFGAW